MLRIGPESIDALIFSHGHYDHFGGLVGFLQHNRSKLRTELPLYLGGEECFCTREWIVGEPQDFGYLKRKALADANVKVVFAETPAMLADHAFHHGPDPFSDLRESVGADANDCRNARRDRLLPRQASGGEERDPRRPRRA